MAVSQEWEGWLTLNKRVVNQSFMTMTMTFWWTKWGVRIYWKVPLAAESCSRDNFWTTFQIFFIFGRIDGSDLYITWLNFVQFSSWPWHWIFKVKYGICYILDKNGPDRHKTKNKHNNWTLSLKCDHQVWPWPRPWRWGFQGQLWNLLYLSWIWSDCNETKNKHIDWTLSLKYDHWIWLWLWPWPWMSKVKYIIHYILAKTGPIASKQKANISNEL